MNRTRNLNVRARTRSSALLVGGLTLLITACDRDQASSPPAMEAAEPPLRAYEAPSTAPAQLPPSAPPPSTRQAAPSRSTGGPSAAGPSEPATAPLGAQAGQAGDVSDRQVDKFTQALSATMGIQQNLQEDLAKAQSEQEAKALQQKAVEKMRDRVEATGMDIHTYSALSQQLGEDEQLRSRVEERLARRGTL